MVDKINNKKEVVSIREWVLANFLMLIPIVNIVMLLIWVFDNKTNLNKSNWAKATLIVWFVGFIFYFIIIILSLTFISKLFNNLFMFHV